jgi:hypothetical protein
MVETTRRWGTPSSSSSSARPNLRLGTPPTGARASGGGHRAEGLVWTQTPKLARESDEELVPAVRASHSGDAVVKDAAIEIAVDRWLDAAAQVAVLFLEVLLVDEQEAFEVLRESSIENRAFGMA